MYNKNNMKIYIIVLFLFIIFTLVMYIYVNKDTLFKNIVIIEYPNGCNITYINGKYINESCKLIGSSVRNKDNNNGNNNLSLFDNFNVVGVING